MRLYVVSNQGRYACEVKDKGRDKFAVMVYNIFTLQNATQLSLFDSSLNSVVGSINSPEKACLLYDEYVNKKEERQKQIDKIKKERSR